MTPRSPRTPAYGAVQPGIQTPGHWTRGGPTDADRNRDAQGTVRGAGLHARRTRHRRRPAPIPASRRGRRPSPAKRRQFGGIKVGSAFFGWLAATGMAVLLTALVAAAGTAVGLATNTDVNEAVNQAATNQTVGLVGIIVLLVILFVSYYCGGYVAGRMARFNGAKQGMMVWIWALIAAVVVAVLGLIAGQQFNILANLNSFPRIPVNEGQLTTTSIIAAVVVAAGGAGGRRAGRPGRHALPPQGGPCRVHARRRTMTSERR